MKRLVSTAALFVVTAAIMMSVNSPATASEMGSTMVIPIAAAAGYYFYTSGNKPSTEKAS